MTIIHPYASNYEQVLNGQAVDSDYICYAFELDYRTDHNGKPWKAGYSPRKTYLGSATGKTWQEAELNAVKTYKKCSAIETWDRHELVSTGDASCAGW